MKRLLLLVIIAIVAAACGDTSGEPPGTSPPTTPSTTPPQGLDLPTDPATVVLSLEFGGGLVMPQVAVTEMPAAVLYGDGTVITEGARIEIFPPPLDPAIVTGTMDRAQMEELVRMAIEAGVTDPLDSYGNPPIADAASARFVIDAGDGEQRLSVYALGFDDPGELVTEEQATARARLSAFADAFRNAAFEAATEPYDYDRLAVVTGEYFAEPEPPQSELPWPLDDLATVGEPVGDLGLRCFVLEGDRLAEVQPLFAAANELTPWISGEVAYQLTLRPLLPHETGCADLN